MCCKLFLLRSAQQMPEGIHVNERGGTCAVALRKCALIMPGVTPLELDPRWKMNETSAATSKRNEARVRELALVKHCRIRVTTPPMEEVSN